MDAGRSAAPPEPAPSASLQSDHGSPRSPALPDARSVPSVRGAVARVLHGRGDPLFQNLRGTKHHHPTHRDRRHLAGLRVTAHPRSLVARDEGAESRRSSPSPPLSAALPPYRSRYPRETSHRDPAVRPRQAQHLSDRPKSRVAITNPSSSLATNWPGGTAARSATMRTPPARTASLVCREADDPTRWLNTAATMTVWMGRNPTQDGTRSARRGLPLETIPISERFGRGTSHPATLRGMVLAPRGRQQEPLNPSICG